MCVACSLKITVRHVVPSALGRTHASSVIPVVRSSSAWSGIRTWSSTPSNDSAPAVRPAADQTGPPVSVPGWPRPERSASVVPEPSSNEYAATRPGSVVAARSKLAVRLSPPGGTVTGCDCAPPSDHEANV